MKNKSAVLNYPGESVQHKVLIVDDEPIIGNLLEVGLSEAGFEAEYFNSTAEALENVNRIRPDIIISDTIMPHMDGYELRRRLRQDPDTATIPFVFLSAKTESPNQLEALRMGADDYVFKPFKIEYLIDRMRDVIDRSSGKGRSAPPPRPSQADLEDHLAQMNLSEVMQYIGLARKSGELVLHSPRGEEIARAFFLKGNLINARMDVLNGEEAFYGLMGEEEGYFEFHDRMIDIPRQISDDNMSILFNGIRMVEDTKSLYRKLSGLDIFLNVRSRNVSPEIEETVGKERLWHVLSMISKQQTIRDIINCGMMSRIRAASILNILLNADVVNLQNHKPGPEPISPPPVAEAEPPSLQVSEPAEHFASVIEKKFLKMLKTFEQGKFTGVLDIRNRPEKAGICFQNGQIIHAFHGNVFAKKALYRIFSDKGGHLKFKSQKVNADRTIEGSLQSLTEEGSREIENYQRLRSSTFENVVSVNTEVSENNPKITGRPGLKHILSLVRQNTTIRDIINESQMTDFQAYRHLFYMVRIGVLSVKAKKTTQIQLITDSTADLPPDILEDRNITLVPLAIHSSQKICSNGVNAGHKQFNPLSGNAKVFPVSSSPAIKDFHHLFRKIVPYKDILAIFLSKKISKTFENALAAKKKNHDAYLRQRQQEYLEERVCNIEIIDSQLVSLGVGLLVLEAADKIELGWAIDEVRDHIESLIPRIRTFFVLDPLAYLQQKKQIGRVKAMMGYLLGIRPILSIWNGEVTIVDQVRGGKNTRQRLTEWMRRDLEDLSAPIKAGVMHSDVPELAAQMRDMLEAEFNCQNIVMSHAGAAPGSYCGTGTVAVSYFSLTDA
ncbi:MAG: hypothetical protein B6245_16805 [Desulfobacteraceae bacterium 4572_88]|nr:MAG: hypothetical protein B6245_16805 [Desulfobacteraceae bacterium 4572_88]